MSTYSYQILRIEQKKSSFSPFLWKRVPRNSSERSEKKHQHLSETVSTTYRTENAVLVLFFAKTIVYLFNHNNILYIISPCTLQFECLVRASSVVVCLPMLQRWRRSLRQNIKNTYYAMAYIYLTSKNSKQINY